MHIIAYAFDAAIHCVDCAKSLTKGMPVDHTHPHGMGCTMPDEHRIEYDTLDHDGNLIHPVFDIEEGTSDLTCDTCKERVI